MFSMLLVCMTRSCPIANLQKFLEKSSSIDSLNQELHTYFVCQDANLINLLLKRNLCDSSIETFKILFNTYSLQSFALILFTTK